MNLVWIGKKVFDLDKLSSVEPRGDAEGVDGYQLLIGGEPAFVPPGPEAEKIREFLRVNARPLAPGTPTGIPPGA